MLKSRIGSNGFTLKTVIVGQWDMNWLNAAWLSIFFFWFCLEPYLEIVNKDIETLIRCGIHHKREARNEMISIISQIQQFALKYTSFLNEDQSRTNLDGNQFEINVNVRSDMELCSLFFVAVGVLTFFTILCSRWCGCWAWSFLWSVSSFESHREEYGWLLRRRDYREDPWMRM